MNKNFYFRYLLFEVIVYMKDFFKTLWDTDAGKAFRKYHDYRYKQPDHYIECPYCGSNKTSECRGSLIKDIKSLFGRKSNR